MPGNKNKKKTYSSKGRIRFVLIVFLIVCVGFVGRLYQLQIDRGDYYAALAHGRSSEFNFTPPPRGNIYLQDRGGESRYLAATNKEAPIVYGQPQEIEDAEKVLDKIKEIVDELSDDEEKILNRLENKDSQYALIARNLTGEQRDEVEDLNLKGIYTRIEKFRYYPTNSVASHILGFLGFAGNDRVGRYGVEEKYEGLLAGSEARGDISFLKALFGRKDLAQTPSDVELTIDYGAQFIIAQKLEEVAERYNADSVTAIFMDPSTGAIISMVNVPNFDPNNYRRVEDSRVFRNTAVQSRYEVGSVFKPITMAIAIDAGAINPDTTYNDTGTMEASGHTIRNVDREAYGITTMKEALNLSLNLAFVFAQQEVGKEAFREYMEAFRLDDRTNIDLPGEVRNDIDNIQQSSRDIEFATASFGQGTAFSPIGLLSAMSAIANDGVIMRPHVVNKVIKGGEEIYTEPEELANPISSLTASRVTAMMVSTVDEGFGSKAAVPGYKVAGKTGTAQVPRDDGPGYSSETIHSFVGFAPAHNPSFVGIVKLENPKGIRFASDSVAPVFGDIASYLLQYYKVPPAGR